MGLKPIGDRIIVRREAAEEKTAGGILLPDTAKNKPQRGKVARRRPRQDARRTAPAPHAGQGRRHASCSPPGPATSSRTAAADGDILRHARRKTSSRVID